VPAHESHSTNAKISLSPLSILVLQWTPQRLRRYSMNNELTESSLLILNIVSASRLATLN
jgi:hypothetical protein